MRPLGAAITGMFAGLLLGAVLADALPDGGAGGLAALGATAGLVVERRSRGPADPP